MKKLVVEGKGERVVESFYYGRARLPDPPSSNTESANLRMIDGTPADAGKEDTRF